MKHYALFILFFVSLSVSAQKYFTKTGTTNFKASVEAFEPVEATNKSTTVILDTSNGNIAGLLFVKAFHFEIALMQEHFNENYMDSDKYPKATFKGKLEGFSMSKISKKGTKFKLKGILTVRGKDKPINTIAIVKKEGNTITIESAFSVKPQNFDIEIPSLVRKKIAKSINVNLDYELIPKK